MRLEQLASKAIPHFVRWVIGEGVMTSPSFRRTLGSLDLPAVSVSDAPFSALPSLPPGMKPSSEAVARSIVGDALRTIADMGEVADRERLAVETLRKLEAILRGPTTIGR